MRYLSSPVQHITQLEYVKRETWDRSEQIGWRRSTLLS
jgi:hypothetical protein